MSWVLYNTERWSHNYNPFTALEFENVLLPVESFLLYKENSVKQELIFQQRPFLQCRKFSLVESQCESQQSVCTVLKAEKKGKLSLYLEDGKREVYK